MDTQLSEAVQEAFIRLFDEGLIYRGQRLVNWDPKLGTAISDLEVISSEEAGFLWHIHYPLVENEGYLTVATTRPETLLGDAAIAVHPEDESYQHLIGKSVHLPLTSRTIPIIADTYVDREFGTGCVKITPAHDFNDYAVGQRHNLPLINILHANATLNDNVPEIYRGLDRLVARKKIVADLEAAGLLEKTEPHTLKVPRGDRSNEIIEPFLTFQWYVKTQPLAEPAIKAVESGEIRFIPENWSKTYFQWMHNIEDWCISRQLWWGHRIPAWYDESGNIYVGKSEADIRQKYHLDNLHSLKQDPDVLDTWFSSALWPFSTLGWPATAPELTTFYPTHVLVTGFDIIFFWVARMIMFGLKFMKQIPFKEVYITGLIRDHEGQKMSKSKGNILDPIDLIDGIDLDQLINKRITGLMQPAMAAKIEKATRQQFPEGISAYGTDALRLTFYSISGSGRDLRFELNRLESSRNFCNKLWNAARYVLMNVAYPENLQAFSTPLLKPAAVSQRQDAPEHRTAAYTLVCEDSSTGATQPLTSAVEFQKRCSLADKWITAKLQKTIQEVTKQIDQYRFDFATQALYEFTWHHYCDWYLELAKVTLMSDDEQAKQATRYTLIHVLEQLLCLLHPFMPFITEAIWQQIYPLTDQAILSSEQSIMMQPYPHYDETKNDGNILAEMAWIQNVIVAIRTIRSEMNINPGKHVPILIRGANKEEWTRFITGEILIRSLAKIESVAPLAEDENAPAAATALVGNMEIFIPLAGLIDLTAEMVRLDKEILKLNNEITKCETKLGNATFVDKAPEAIVNQEKVRLSEFKAALSQLLQQKENLGK